MIYLKLFLAFMKIGFFSFGGMTMLPVINDVVLVNGWMTADEVLDIAAIAEMTPGSLGLNCATFVGLKTAGAAGAVCASAGVMVPSFTLCLAAAVFIERMKGNQRVESILKGIRPVCVGMLFAAGWTMGSPLLFEGGGLMWNQAALMAIVGGLMFKYRLPVGKTLLIAAAAGLVMG